MNAIEATREILRFSQHLHQKNYLAACDGNLSARLDDGRILITPTARPKAFLREDEMAMMDSSGLALSGAPSGEKWMHLAIYRCVPTARAVVHAHPPVATAWSIARPDLEELPSEVISELILAVGRIPIVPFRIPGSPEMGAVLESYLPEHRAMILAKHGAIAWGETLEEAYIGIERLEHAAVTLAAAVQLATKDTLSTLAARDVETLRRMRQAGPQRTF